MFVKRFDLKDHKLHVIIFSANSDMQVSPVWNRELPEDALQIRGEREEACKSMNIHAMHKCNYFLDPKFSSLDKIALVAHKVSTAYIQL